MLTLSERWLTTQTVVRTSAPMLAALPAGPAPDAVQCTGETLSNVTSPWRFVVFSFIADIPGLGRRKVVFLDQRNTYPATTILKDTFTDANTTLLTAHGVGPGQSVALLLSRSAEAIVAILAKVLGTRSG